MTGRFSLKGELTVHVEPDIDFSLTSFEARFRGSFEAMEGPFRLTLEGPVGELRKLAPVSPAIASILRAVEDKEATAEGKLTLEAKSSHTYVLAGAMKRTPEGDVQALLENVPFMTLLRELDQYDVVSIGVVTERTSFDLSS